MKKDEAVEILREFLKQKPFLSPQVKEAITVLLLAEKASEPTEKLDMNE